MDVGHLDKARMRLVGELASKRLWKSAASSRTHPHFLTQLDRLAMIILLARRDKLEPMTLVSNYDLVAHGTHIAAILALDETKLGVIHYLLSGRWSGVIHS
jgi:hypothetical protein